MSRQEGQISAFTAAVTVALLLVAGLVLDGGRLLAAKRAVINDAEQAARAGAQALDLDALRAGGPQRLDAEAAAAAAHRYLDRIGRHGQAAVLGDRVVVTVTVTVTPAILALAGFGPRTLTGRGEARNIRGVREAQT